MSWTSCCSVALYIEDARINKPNPPLYLSFSPQEALTSQETICTAFNQICAPLFKIERQWDKKLMDFTSFYASLDLQSKNYYCFEFVTVLDPKLALNISFTGQLPVIFSAQDHPIYPLEPGLTTQLLITETTLQGSRSEKRSETLSLEKILERAPVDYSLVSFFNSSSFTKMTQFGVGNHRVIQKLN